MGFLFCNTNMHTHSVCAHKHTRTHGGHLCVPYHLRLFDSWCALICAVLLPAFEVKIPVTFASLALIHSLSLCTQTHKSTKHK